jgi:hypothetical protein
MNVKFGHDGLRCRITNAELERLLSGRAVMLEVPLPRGHAFRANINLTSGAEWQFESDPTGIWISIPKSEVRVLADSLPSKEGIRKEFETAHGNVAVVFEVDVRDQKHPHPNPLPSRERE